jgi:flagellar motor switch/type III secretory pathway protein FliN
MADPVDQPDNIEALLESVRQVQRDVGAGPGDEAPTQGAGWERIGPLAGSVLDAAMAAAWRRHGVTGELARAATVRGGAPAARVVRLGQPLDERLWMLWEDAEEGSQEAPEAFLRALQAEVPALEGWTTLPVDTPPPEDALCLPYEAVGAHGALPLCLAMEAALVERLEAALSPSEATAPSGEPAGGRVQVDALEVQAAVYVGGGLYPLSELAALRPGTLLPLQTDVGERAILAIGGRVVGYGEIVVTPEDALALRLTRVVLGKEGRQLAPAWLEQTRPPSRHGS